MNDFVDVDQAQVEQALHGDPSAIEAIRALVTAVINKRNPMLCKKFCYDNYKKYLCTFNQGVQKIDAPLCDKGNESFCWMFDYLTHQNRLVNFAEKNEGSYLKYIMKIVYSVQFFERWKDHRFNRRIRVPPYIEILHKQAKKIFFYLYDGDHPANIAQRLNMDEVLVKDIVTKIQRELIKRKKLGSLLGNPVVSYEELEESDPFQIPSETNTPENNASSLELERAWNQLDALEQFVVYAMDVEDTPAPKVLLAIKEEQLDMYAQKKIKNVDQIYYIRDKVRAKIKLLLQSWQPKVIVNERI